jgi:hypothetical protein
MDLRGVLRGPARCDAMGAGLSRRGLTDSRGEALCIIPADEAVYPAVAVERSTEDAKAAGPVAEAGLVLEAEDRGSRLGLGRVETYVLRGLGWIFGIRFILRADLEVPEFVDVIHLAHMHGAIPYAHRPVFGVLAGEAVPQRG